ncbi:MAG: hypothetical protein ACRD5J_03995 [Nitrososphaeraceae archaeon]
MKAIFKIIYQRPNTTESIGNERMPRTKKGLHVIPLVVNGGANMIQKNLLFGVLINQAYINNGQMMNYYYLDMVEPKLGSPCVRAGMVFY